MDGYAGIRLLLSLLKELVLPGSISSIVSVNVVCTALAVSSSETLIEQSMMKRKTRNMRRLRPIMLPQIISSRYMKDIRASAQYVNLIWAKLVVARATR